MKTELDRIEQIEKNIITLKKEIEEIKSLLKEMSVKQFEDLENIFDSGFSKIRDAQKELEKLQNMFKL